MLIQREIDWRGSRAVDRGLVTQLAGWHWLRHGYSVLVTAASEYAT